MLFSLVSMLLEKTRKYNWGKRETFSFTTSEGVKLDGWMVKPVDFDASKKYPVILFQYSGPGNQQVLDSWSTGSMGNGGAFDYYLAQEGFIIACVDGRGTVTLSNLMCLKTAPSFCLMTATL